MIIRLAEENEYPAIATHYRICNYRAELSPEDQIVIAINDEIIGAVRICNEYGTRVLRGMHVKKAFQRQGIGSLILQYLDEQINMAGCYCLPYKHLDTFYSKIGFKEISPSNAPVFLKERLDKYVNEGYGEMIVMKLDQYSIRIFSPKDLQLYKRIRLEALQSEPGVFGSSYALESGFTDEKWLSRISNETGACFGLFCKEELIGLTGIYIDPGKAALGQLTQSYIRKQFRGKGLSALLYDARIAWAKDRGLKSLQIGHRESNIASRAANQRYGFKYTDRESTQWPDGDTEDLLYYELNL